MYNLNFIDQKKYFFYLILPSLSSILLQLTNPFEITSQINHLKLNIANGNNVKLPYFFKISNHEIAFSLFTILNHRISIFNHSSYVWLKIAGLTLYPENSLALNICLMLVSPNPQLTLTLSNDHIKNTNSV